ncbi:GNAT family protein [Armatimonas sp.]|uniref:GNAT family N-acetyltransferase n=1 Tax=Armatimonas sp. TaxID=1872638 RepID=UPI00286ADD19|nr:GNAT family protein [Armatimonas sp.]
MFGPTIEGEHVRLVPLTLEMAPLFCAWFADTEVTKYLSLSYPPTLDFEKEWLEKVGRNNTDLVWAVQLRGSEKLIGTTGLHQLNWQNRSAVTGNLIGAKEEWGKGYASEIVALRTAYAFGTLGLEKLTTLIYTENIASRRALEKAGYQTVGVARHERWHLGRWHDAWLGEILRDDWLAAQQD